MGSGILLVHSLDSRGTEMLLPLQETCKRRDCVRLDVWHYDRDGALEELMSTKAGVKDLVDSGITKVPEIFKLPTEMKATELYQTNYIQNGVPMIDLQGPRRKDIINEIRQASRRWGIFQVVNHGVPVDVMNNMLASVRQFHEKPKEFKEEFYSHDASRKKVWYYMTVHPYLRSAFWKDTIAWQFDNIIADSEELPLVCRKPMFEYVRYVNQVKEALSKLLSEALGLDSDHLELMKCMEARKLAGHYYPACPEPELTMGTPKHSDPYFLTILMQDDIGGLQVLHQNQWVDVPPVNGALIAIIGDLLQLISNDLFTSAEHRVLAPRTGIRLSTACFFYPNNKNKDWSYGPIKELMSDNNPPLYKDTTHTEYLKCFSAHGSCGSKVLPHLRR